MQKTRWFVAAALAAGMVVAVNAQQRQRGQGGFGAGTGPISLLKNKAVAEDIKLSDDQIEKLKTWVKEYEPKAQEKLQAKLKEIPQDTPFQERFAKMAPILAEANKETYRELEGVLKPEQVKRVKQIELQRNGLRAFRSDEVVNTLKLTDEQKEFVKGVSDDLRKETGEAMRGSFGKDADKAKQEEAQKTVAKLTKDALAKVSEKLTAEQKTAWKEMAGEPFDVSKLPPQFGFGGGFGQPGGRPQPKQKSKD